MAIRFHKSIKIAPGIRMNLGLKSAGISFGGKGLRYTINSRNGHYVSAGIPGTGLYYMESLSNRQYKSPAYQHHQQLAQKQRNVATMNAYEQAAFQVELYENRIHMLKSIHEECDDLVDWDDVRKTPPPFQLGNKGPKELAAEKALYEYKPNFLQKWFKRDEKKRAQLTAELEKGKKEDQEDFQEWSRMVQTAKKITEGDPDAYLQVIEEMAPLDDLSEFGSGFEFFVEDSETIEVEFEIHGEDVIPQEVLSLTKTGKLSQRKMGKTIFYDLLQEYISSCTIRIARDVFALLPVEKVLIHAYDESLNTATGHEERVLILSVAIDKPTLERLNLDAIDCSDALTNFPYNMEFRKTKGFRIVEKIKLP